MTFAQLNLNPEVTKAILACGYTIPTPIQARSIPDILNGKDLVASAQTGTGKTAAFVLPALHHLSLKKGTGKARVLILTPTRELASQITTAVNKYSKFLRVNTLSVVGGMPYGQQIKGLSRGVDIIVATPGRLIDHLESGRLNLSGIEMLILDEADRMLDMGFIDDVTAIANATPGNRQTLLFSATVDNNLTKVIRQLLKNPVQIDLSNEGITPDQIQQELYMADHIQHKMQLLQHFLDNGNIFKAIIFSATKIHADQLAKQLTKQGHAAAALHGDLRQNVRNRTIDQLRTGRIQFLVATDVAARGINITDITHVFNFDLPRFAEDYVHRIGRTGRAGKTGIAISFALHNEGSLLQKIERYIGQKVPTSSIPGLEPTKRFSSSAGSHSKKRGGGRSQGGSSRFEGARGGRSGGGRFDSAKSRGGDSRFDGPKNRSSNDGFDAPKSRSNDRFDRPKTARSNDRSDSPRSRGGDRFDAPRAPRTGDRFDRPKSSAPRSSDRSDSPRSRGGDRFDSPRSSRTDDRFERPKSAARSSDRSDSPRSRGGDRFDGPRTPRTGGDRFDRPRSAAPRSSDRSDSPRSRSSDRSDRPRSTGAPRTKFDGAKPQRSRFEGGKPSGAARKERVKKDKE